MISEKESMTARAREHKCTDVHPVALRSPLHARYLFPLFGICCVCVTACLCSVIFFLVMDTPPSGEGALGLGARGPAAAARARARASASSALPSMLSDVHVPDGNLLVGLKDCLSPYGHGYHENPPVLDGVSTDPRTYVPLDFGPRTSLDPTCTLYSPNGG